MGVTEIEPSSRCCKLCGTVLYIIHFNAGPPLWICIRCKLIFDQHQV